MIERPDVETLLAGPLGQWLETQASVRAEAREQSNWRFVWTAAAAMPALALVMVIPWDVLKVVFFTGVMWGGWWAYAPRAAAIRQTKQGINAAIAEALGLEYEMNCGGGSGFDRAMAHLMLPSHDRRDFEDKWSGTVAGHAFTLREAHLEERRGSGKNRSWVTVFRGVLLTLGFPRAFHGTTLVERSGRHKRFGFFGEKAELEVEGRVLARADMVHPEFEDAFTVYSDDAVEARYLVHPAYIERLIALEAAFGGQDIRTLFKDGELTVVLSAANMFESGSMDARRDREMVEMAVAQFMAMAELAGTLNEGTG